MPEQSAAEWHFRRRRAVEALEDLREVMADERVDERELIAQYLVAKQILAGAFEALAAERFGRSAALAEAVSAIERALAASYPEVPASIRRVTGFGKAHRRLLGALMSRVGEPVSVIELRMLTGDAIHTERRTRELRQLGFTIDAVRASGLDSYMLTSGEQDVTGAARDLLKRRIEDAASLTDADRERLLSSL